MRVHESYALLLGSIQGRLLYTLTLMDLTICCSDGVILGILGEYVMALLESIFSQGMVNAKHQVRSHRLEVLSAPSTLPLLLRL
jgi:hypothetical protein